MRLASPWRKSCVGGLSMRTARRIRTKAAKHRASLARFTVGKHNDSETLTVGTTNEYTQGMTTDGTKVAGKVVEVVAGWTGESYLVKVDGIIWFKSTSRRVCAKWIAEHVTVEG